MSSFAEVFWIPAFAGMTVRGSGMTVRIGDNRMTLLAKGALLAVSTPHLVT